MDDNGLTGRALFQEAANELLNGVEMNTDASDVERLSAAEEPVEDQEVAPEEVSEEQVEEDVDEATLDDDDYDEDDDGDLDDAEEEDEAIAGDISMDTEFDVTIDGEVEKATLKDLLKNYGREGALNKREMANADRGKELDELQNTITHLQYQGEFAPQFYQLNQQKAALDDAKEALAKGEAYHGVSGDQLVKEITQAEVIVKRSEEKLVQEYTEKTQGVDAPGRKALESRLPDIAEKFTDYATEWSKVGREFGFTDVELANNADFRWYNLAQEVVELRAEKKANEERRARNKERRQGGSVASKGSPPKKTPTTSKKKAKQVEADFETQVKAAREGNRDARRGLMGSFLNNM